VQVMRRENLNSFILPVLLQYVPEVNPELIQLNYLDFSTGWVTGLVRLLDKMEKLGVSRRDSPNRSSMDRWLAVQAHLAGAVKDGSVVCWRLC
jgi:hypothetical protein